MKVLLVDDDRELADLLRFAFQRAGFAPLISHDVPGALRVFATERPDVAIVDVNLGLASGFDLLAELRRTGTRIPILMLTALDAEDDKIKGLELGADDYVTKPFSHRELVARVRAHLRGAGDEVPADRASRERIEVGPLVLSAADHSVVLDGAPLALTVTEFRLLHALMERAGTIVTDADLLERVWGNEGFSPEVIRTAVHRLRRKLGDDAANPRLLHRISGVGVMVKAP